jgi:hypothetical protein
VGAHSYVGSGSSLDENVRLSAGSVIKPRTKVAKPDPKHLRRLKADAQSISDRNAATVACASASDAGASFGT